MLQTARGDSTCQLAEPGGSRHRLIQAGRPRNLEWLGALLAVTLTAVVISFNLAAPLSTYDGGISASAATFTLHGLLPYRDYWLLYGPLSGFLLAIPTAFLGPTIDLTRGFGFVVFCCEAVVAYRLARVWEIGRASCRERVLVQV